MEKPNTSGVCCTGRYVALLALTSVLTACGGSGGETDTASQDFDMDGLPNDSDPDADGDGTIDAFDPFVDLDGDGLDDNSFLTQEEAESDNQDTDDVATSECDPESGTIAFGQTSSWNANCTIRRSINGGEFADSLYSVGVQRIVFCAGFGEEENDDYRFFADGEYGPASEAATQEFQASTPGALTDDGIVGPDTWAKLQNALTVLEFGDLDENTGEVSPDIYGFEEGRCEGIPLFFQDVTYNEATDQFFRAGWRLAQNAPDVNEADALPFSIELPFGLLEVPDTE